VPSFVEVTARARNCLGPTLSRGRVSAYDAPPSATNNAQRATAIAGEGSGTLLPDIGHSLSVQGRHGKRGVRVDVVERRRPFTSASASALPARHAG
jgi:hypothetical protein